MDTCFYCVVGWSKVVPKAPKRPATNEGFGTCKQCSAHACPQHGDKTPTIFLCVDCIGSAAITPPLRGEELEHDRPGDGGSEELRALVRARGSEVFPGVAPAVAAPALAHVDEPNLERLRFSLDWFAALARLGQLGAWVEMMLVEQIEAAPVDALAGALGLPPSMAERAPREEVSPESIRSAAQTRAVAMATDLARRYDGEALQPDTDKLDVAAMAIRICLYPRGATSVDINVANLAGGLLLPVEIAATVLLYHAQGEPEDAERAPRPSPEPGSQSGFDPLLVERVMRLIDPKRRSSSGA
ncbi:MAG TPA: hypothetical protein VF712_18370 [Thermoleophilaceae bacterium]|jgi:hypothetical protein